MFLTGFLQKSRKSQKRGVQEKMAQDSHFNRGVRSVIICLDRHVLSRYNHWISAFATVS